jgi:type 2A phosphatase activator TIP41
MRALTHSRLSQEEALPPVQVACAAAWSRAHCERLAAGAISGWAAGEVARSDDASSASSAASAAAAPYDWTYTTPYAGTLEPPGASDRTAPLSWRPVAERIDRTLLLARDPILFFDELTLYESELDDNGTMSLTVKARQRIEECMHERLRACVSKR